MTAWTASVALALLFGHGTATAQSSDNPSDVTTGLTFTTTTGTTTPLPATCSPTGSLNPASGDFTLSGSTSTPTSVVGPPVCGNFLDLPPAAPNPANDVWFRVDPPAATTRFRFTLFAGTAPAMVNGAMALYEAPSAAGPFRLIECAVGGSLTTALPSVEAGCFTSGNKLYLRVWDESARASNVQFTICVQGQTDASMASRGAAETACSATTIAASAVASNIDYVFACEESTWLQSDSAYVGGDLWLKLTVPASGIVRMIVARGSATAGTVQTVGLSAYVTPDCSNPVKFRQVGNFTSALPTTLPTVANWTISCLNAGETLYVRIHSLKAAQASQKRYGRLRFSWTAGAAGTTPPSNNQPCGATPLAFNVSCPVTPGSGGNFDACNTPGIPAPSCGGFDATSRDVWYSFVAPASGTVFIEASAGSGFPADPAMALYTTGGNGCSGRFTLIACDDRRGVGNGARIIRTDLVPGQTYYVRAWAEGTDAQGAFSLCISEPALPPGSCFYLIDLWALNAQGTQYMDVSVNGGAPTTYSSSGGDASELFLLPLSPGSSAAFTYYNSGTNGLYIYGLTRLGDTTQLWQDDGGVPVAGPTPPPQYRYTLNNACQALTPLGSDCLGSETVCTPNTEFGNLVGTLPPGNRYDLTAANMGCLESENKGIAWLIFRPIQNGTVAFWFDGTTNAPNTDLDFAIWDAGPIDPTPTLPNINSNICAPNGPPVRCSSARRNYSTGLMPGLQGVYQEGNGGWGWLSPLPVVADHAYLIALVRGSGTVPNVQFQMRWTLYTDASGTPSNTMLDCTPLILPVELLFLQADGRDRLVDLTWATASERNSSHFVVERSSDAQHFTAIGEVPASGDSQHRIDYAFLDASPFDGLNYYRLAQVDRDGTTAYSNVVVAMIGGAGDPPMIYPNPVKDRLLTAFTVNAQGQVDLRVIDALGRMVLEQASTADRGRRVVELDAQRLVPGTYLVHVVGASGEVIGSARFVKE